MKVNIAIMAIAIGVAKLKIGTMQRESNSKVRSLRTVVRTCMIVSPVV